MSSYNIYGGTPKKTLDLMKFLKEDAVLYVYNDAYPEFKYLFDASGGKVYEGFYGRNYFKHINRLLKIIKENNIEIIQTQFSMGEFLGFLIKQCNSKIKLLVAFVGSQKPSFIKSVLLRQVYKKVDSFIYISNYVKSEKEKQFPALKKKTVKIIFNGTAKRMDTEIPVQLNKSFSLFSISGLIPIKNIQVIIKAMDLIINNYKQQNIYLYVAGDGPMRNELEVQIRELSLTEHVHLLGYQENIGGLLNNCDLYVHPCYKEGFGIAVIEGMMAEKPIIVSNAGALPELIVNEESGLVVEPHNAEQWADAILRVVDDPILAKKLASNAKERAQKKFTKDIYTQNYLNLYNSLVDYE